MGIRTGRAHHPRLCRRARLPVGRCRGPALSVELVEYSRKKFFAVLHDILKRDSAALDIRFIHMVRDAGHVAYLLREEYPASRNNGTERQQSSLQVPLF